jgi:nucleoside-diphosphate-sugar epimerase
VELQRGDLTAPGSIEKLVDGIDGVIHVAAKVEDFGRRAEFEGANVTATMELYQAALRTGCRRFVFVSSITVHGFGRHVDSTEAGPYYPLHSHYQRTKLAAERLLLEGTVRGLRPIIVRPGLVYGPGDRTTLVPVLDLLKRRLLPYIGGFRRLNCPVYVTDLVDGVLLAFERPDAAHQVYNITSGEKTSLREPVDTAADLLGVPRPRIDIPPWIARVGGGILECGAYVVGSRRAPLLTRFRAAELTSDFHFSTDRARAELGYDPQVRWQEGLRAAVADCR